jgi:ribosomal protein S18 acetylase RimI-like enzyme
MRYTLTPTDDMEGRATLDQIWTRSQDADDRAFRPRGGWWSLSAWAAKGTLLLADGGPIGGLGVNRAPDSAREARLALLPERRTPEAARRLVRAALADVSAGGSPVLRLTLPAAATWARDAADAAGLIVARATLVMLRSTAVGPLLTADVPGIVIRPLAQGEEGRLLHALNHAWARTWNFRRLTRRALERDLAGQREGFLVATDEAGRIAGTVHAQFDQAGQNPDGGTYAWISNLTTAPEWRGRGLGRALLSAGVTALHQRGAQSVALGVDSGAVAPLALYRSAGFAEVDRLELWETPIAYGALVEPGEHPSAAAFAGARDI